MSAKFAQRSLTIWVHRSWLNRPEINELISKGHRVVVVEGEPDLILHPAAHYWSDLMWDYWKAVLDVVKRVAKGGSIHAVDPMVLTASSTEC